MQLSVGPRVRAQGFPVRPTDPLLDVYGIGEDGTLDRDIFLRELAESINLEIVPSTLPDTPVTVQAVVRLLSDVWRDRAASADRLLRAADRTVRGEDALMRPAGSSRAAETELLRPETAG